MASDPTQKTLCFKIEHPATLQTSTIYDAIRVLYILHPDKYYPYEEILNEEPTKEIWKILNSKAADLLTIQHNTDLSKEDVKIRQNHQKGLPIRKWAINNNIQPEILHFTLHRLNNPFQYITKDQENICYILPHTWEEISKTIQNTNAQTPTEIINIVEEITEKPHKPFEQFLNTWHSINPQQYLENPNKVTQLDDMTTKYALTGLLTTEYKNNPNTLHNILKIANNLDPESSLHLLSSTRRANKEHFIDNAGQYNLFKKMGNNYIKYLT